MSERHTTRFQPTTIRLINAIPPASSGKLACAVASLIRLPRPRVTRSVPPASMYSATIEPFQRSEEHTSELQSQSNLVCRLLLEKKKKKNNRVLLQVQLS